MAVIQGPSYAVDLVLTVDCTASMTPILARVKERALRFYRDVQDTLLSKGKRIDRLRVRVVAFRDHAHNPSTAFVESPFYALPQQQEAFSAFVKKLEPEPNTDWPESGLQGLALAINSDWTREGDRRRHVVVVWTDTSPHPLHYARGRVPGHLTSRVPGDFDSLTDLWEEGQGNLTSGTKRLILFAPDADGWSDIANQWENVIHFPSKGGEGLAEIDYRSILDAVGNSV